MADLPECHVCGYDLRGADTAACPECGTPRARRRLVFHDARDFAAAAHVLHTAGIQSANFDPKRGFFGLESVLGGAATAGEIWIGTTDAQRAVATLEQAGVHVPVPIVDRSEPSCPQCGERLDPDGPEHCGQCGGLFHWIEIDEPEIDTTELACRTCGYDLTGNTARRCPECNAPIPRNLDALVNAALAQASEPSGTDTTLPEPEPSRGSVKFWAGLIAGLLTALLLTKVVKIDNATVTVLLVIAGAGAGALIAGQFLRDPTRG